MFQAGFEIGNYSAFGVTIPERNLKKSVVGVRDYAMGFQGQLEDDEIKGEGNSLNYTYRMHDPRLGRFFAIDPLAGDYAYNSPYAFSENRLIDAIELEGLELIFVQVYDSKTNSFVSTYTAYDNRLKENLNKYVYFDKNGVVSRTVFQGFETETKLSFNYEIPTKNGHISANQNDLWALFNTFQSTWYSKQSPALQSAMNAQSVPGKDPTYYDHLEGNHDAVNQGGFGGSAEKEVKTGTKMIIAIATLGFGAPAVAGSIAAGEVSTITVVEVAETVYALDDAVGTTVGACKGDPDGEYKPLKALMGKVPCGTFVYDSGNIIIGGIGTFNNFKRVATGDKSGYVPIYLDGFGTTDSGVEMYEDFWNR